MMKSSMLSLMIASSMASGMNVGSLARTSFEKEIDIEEEYELIKQKKSKLSAKQRQSIVRKVESRRQ